MNIDVQKTVSADDLQWNKYHVAFHGSRLDDRGKAAIDELSHKSVTSIRLSYDPITLEILINDERHEVDFLPNIIQSLLTGPVVLEATTLGFVEILICCKALRKLGVQQFDILYVEPAHYKTSQPRHLLHRRDFELSKEVPGYQAIPGNAILLGDRISQKGIFFVGYEEARLRRAFEDLQMIKSSSSAIVFGVPAFKPGWEMDSIANNISVIREQNIRGGVYFCGAENPAMVIEILAELRQSTDPNQRLFVAPIGTKPHGIGVALFVSRYQNVGIIYDHPQRNEGRSGEVAHWHLFSVRDAWINL